MKHLAAILITITLIILAQPTLAATYIVTPDGTGDYATIAEAIDNTVSGDVIELTPGTFTGQWNRDLSTWGKAITIRSQAGPINTVIDCEGSDIEPHVGFYLNSGEGTDTVIEGITITNGYSGPTSCGGAISLTYSSSPTIRNCRFIDNFAACGGAIFCHPGSPAIQDCFFSGNATNPSGKGGAIAVGSASNPTIEGCTFLDNYASYGGAIACSWDSAPTLYRCVLARNITDNGGGGLFCNDDAVVTMTYCTLTYNDGPFGAGIMLMENAALTIGNTIVAFNEDGEGIYCEDPGAAALNCCDIFGNANGDYVGGIETQYGVDDNFSADPRLCDPEADNYWLAANSPCREEAQTFCGTVGAFDVGCGVINHAFRVNPEGTGDFPTIQAAINYSADGDSVLLADGVYTGEGNRDLSFLGLAITVCSESGDPTACVIDCEGSPGDDHIGFRFWGLETPASTLEGVTITNGWQSSPRCGGAMEIRYDSSPTIRNCRIVDNHADCVGGVFIQTGSPNFIDCVFENNSSGEWSHSGAVFVGQNCGPGFHRCSFINNTAPDGGAVFCRFNGIASFNDCLFRGNSADDDGGSVLCEDESTAYFYQCTFVESSAPEGSVIHVRDTAAATVYLSILAYNEGSPAIDCGGGGNEVTCHNTVFWENAGGNYAGCSPATLNRSNRLINPGFCNLVTGDYRLTSNSPCAEGNFFLGRVGALDVGCPGGAREWILNAAGTGDFPTIQAALDLAMIGDTVTLTDGTYTGDGNRDLVFWSKAITLRSQSDEPGLCVIDCEGTEPDPHRGIIFQNYEGRETVVRGIRIENGYTESHEAGGGIWIMTDASPTLDNCVLANNHAGGAGGLYCNVGSPLIRDCLFLGNTTESYGEGGGLYVASFAQPRIEGCTFAYNTAGEGGGACAQWTGDPIFDHCLFIGNQAINFGGGYFGSTNTSTTLTECTFFENTAGIGGGGVACEDSASVSIENTIIAHSLNGAAVHCDDTATASLRCCDLYANAGGDWVGCIAGQEAIPTNISEDPIFCDVVNTDLHLHSDSPCAWANNLDCGYIGALPVGCGVTVDVPPLDPSPSRVFLTSAPNPFNPSTMISYGIPSHLGMQPVRIMIYDTAGRLVRTLVNEDQGPGTYSVTWDSANGNGEPVAGGIYFYQFNLGGEKRTRQIVLLR